MTFSVSDFLYLNDEINGYLQCCEKVSAPFLSSYLFAYLSQCYVSYHQQVFKFNSRQKNKQTNLKKKNIVNIKCSVWMILFIN